MIKGLPHLCVSWHFSDTDNELTTEVGGYQHVVVLKNIKVVDGDIVEALQQLPRGTTDGDCIHEALVLYSAIIVIFLFFVTILQKVV